MYNLYLVMYIFPSPSCIRSNGSPFLSPDSGGSNPCGAWTSWHQTEPTCGSQERHSGETDPEESEHG